MVDTGAPDDGGQSVVVAWIEKEIGPVRKVWRQGRWRPCWYVDADKDGKPVELYVRGGRGASWPAMPLSYEAEVQRVFREEGVKVPHVYGYIDAVPAIVMDRLKGRPNIATADSDQDRERLREDLADQMRKIHDIDPARLVALGAPTSDDPREQSLLHYRMAEQLYLDGDSLPAPDIEFVRRWIERNAPPCVEGPAVLTVDAGQFMFEGREITGMVDLELACVGDRHVDIAALRTRDQIEEIGDLESFYDLYEKRGGIRLDRDRIAFQWVTFAMLTPLQVAHDLAHPEKAAQYHEYFCWHEHTMVDAIQDIARIIGLKLEPYRLPEPRPGRSSHLLRALASVVESLPAADDYEAYRRFDLASALKFLRDQAAVRTDIEREYLDEVEALIGRRPKDTWDADVQLTEFVQTAGPELDAPILKILHNRNQRALQLMMRHDTRRREGKGVASSET